MNLQIIQVNAENPTGKILEPRLRQFTFYSDDGHGWLRVTKNQATELCFVASEYSFKSPSDKYRYLEEDCDAPRFIKRWESMTGEKIIFKQVRTRGQSKIRGLERC